MSDDIIPETEMVVWAKDEQVEALRNEGEYFMSLVNQKEQADGNKFQFEGFDDINKLFTEPYLEREIWVTFQKEGIHKYPAALTDPALANVSFLGYPHRHMFHFKVALSVEHNDRDIEFILLKRELEALYSGGTLELDYKSCEMIAEDLINYISTTYPGRRVTVEVSEDNENGCKLTYYP